jgi:DNA-binding NarL/FixJ family response regulator
MMGSKKSDKTLLSPRETEVQALRAQGLTVLQIAQSLGIGKGTVEHRLRSIKQRATGAKERTR